MHQASWRFGLFGKGTRLISISIERSAQRFILVRIYQNNHIWASCSIPTKIFGRIGTVANVTPPPKQNQSVLTLKFCFWFHSLRRPSSLCSLSASNAATRWCARRGCSNSYLPCPFVTRTIFFCFRITFFVPAPVINRTIFSCKSQPSF